MAEAIQRTDEDSSLFNTFPSSGPPRGFNPSEDEDAPYSSGGDNRSWNFGADEDAKMRRLRSESAAQKQKAAAEEKRAAQEPKSTKGKRKARVVSEEEEEEKSEEMSMSEGEDADAEVEEEVDIEGELSEDAKSIQVDSEDDDVSQSPVKPRLKIKLKLHTVASSTSNTATPVPEEQKVTPGRRAVAQRSAAVRGRRRIQDLESSSSELESEDGQGPESEQDAEEEDEDEDEEDTVNRAKTGAKGRLTTRQAVLASVVDSSHVALDSDLAAQSVQGSSKKKKVLNETELALRREENARKRKSLSEKKLEDEKYETINRLLKKQSRPRAKRAGGPSSTASSLAPTGASASDPPQRTSLSKRGNHGRRGRAKLIKTQLSSRVPGVRTPGEENGGEGEDGGDAQVEAQGEAMDVDGQAVEAEAEEAEDQVEGEEDEVVEESVGGSDLSKAIRGPLAPMFRWVSTSYPVSAANDSETKHIVERGELAVGAKVDLANAGVVQMEIEPTTTTSLSEHGETSSAIPAQEKQMRLYFAVPAAFLSSSDQVAPLPLSEPRPPAICAVSGCQDPRKYRLVKDWKIGACGIAHLKVLEGMK